MLMLLSRGWRLAATGFILVLFCASGLLLSLLILPLVFLVSWSVQSRQNRSKRLIQYGFRCLIEVLRDVGVLTYSICDRDHWNQPGQLVIANHPSLLDVVFLMAFIRHAHCIVKPSLFRNPCLCLPMKMAGYIASDDPEKVIALAAQQLQQGVSLIIFPEGTRTVPGQALTMKRGAAHIALQAQCDITPVFLRCEPAAFTKAQKWYQVPQRRFHFSISSQSDIKIKPYQKQAQPSLAARQLTNDIAAYYTQGLASDD